MSQVLNIDFDDFVRKVASTGTFNDELFVSKLSHLNANRNQANIYPARLNALMFCLCEYGEISISVDYRDYHLRKGTLFMLNSFHILGRVNTSNYFEAYLVTMSSELVRSIFGYIPMIKKLVVVAERSQPPIELDDEERLCLVNIIERIRKTLQSSGHAFQNYILKNEVSNFLLEAANIKLKKNKDEKAVYEVNHKDEVLKKFIRLIFDNYKEQHEVSFYAKELYMTPGNLSRIIKAFSGKTAGKWISDTIIAESKMLLRKPNINIQQVSDELHFGDQSSFGKFFKKHTGLTPMEYRNSGNMS